MQITHRKTMLWLTGLGLTLSLFTGCQTWEGGMTLPSGRYLQHTPQYLPQEPDFPLPREQAYQEEKAGLLGPNVAVLWVVSNRLRRLHPQCLREGNPITEQVKYL